MAASFFTFYKLLPRWALPEGKLQARAIRLHRGIHLIQRVKCRIALTLSAFFYRFLFASFLLLGSCWVLGPKAPSDWETPATPGLMYHVVIHLGGEAIGCPFNSAVDVRLCHPSHPICVLTALIPSVPDDE